MDAHVGAKLEVVPRQSLLAAADWGYLAILIAVSIAIHGWLISHTTVTARDSLTFARMALNLGHPEETTAPTIGPNSETPRPPTFLDVLRKGESHHPPAYPVMIYLVSLASGPASVESLPQTVLTSAQIVSAIAAVLLVFPTYWLGRMLFGKPFVGFGGAILFQVAPVIAHITSDGLSESLYLLFVSSALAFGVRAARTCSVGGFLACGMMSSVAYLVRPEGLMVVLAVAAAITIMGFLRRWPRDQAIGRLASLGVGVLLVAVPYMAIIGKISNKPTWNSIVGQLKGNQPNRLWMKGTTGERAVVQTTLFADWYDPVRDASKYVWAVKAIVKETFKTAHYAAFVLGLIGVVLFRKKLFEDVGFGVVIVLAIVNTSVLAMLGIMQGYVSERHTVLLALLACIFAVAAIEPLLALFRIRASWAPAVVLLLLVGSAVPAAMKPPHESRIGHKAAGEFLRGKVGPKDALIDPYDWAAWYAGYTQYRIPAFPDVPEYRWVVIELGKSPHSRLPMHEAAKNVVNDSKNKAVRMYHWPADGPPEDATVFVYRQKGDGT